MTAAANEEVCCEIRCHRAKSDRILYSRVSRRDKVLSVCLTRFAAFVSILLSCAALLLHAYQHKAADNQLTSAGSYSIGYLQQQQVRTNPSAHLTAPASFNNSKREYLEWEDKLGLAHLSDFEYDDGDLIVLKDGVYEVYLQITFRRPSHFVCSKEGPVFILSQRVILFAMNYQNDRDLLTASDTVYCSQPPGSEGCMEDDSVIPYWEKSPHTSGVFQLKAGDRLRVSNEDWYHELMLLQEDKTFFGAYLI
ncbi:tumor necrosis factor ligand superfamily member 6 [Salvelinus fontinalis]|uniref:tumor necrosis factor ligand superfamily member 6 n=1 Tax=Salvelinus fontinalis TaxID=8038 RepID=UPI0024858628|nr:tumor necrosis factor ligand superfamily member 6 [Salvelinus fontinalis]